MKHIKRFNEEFDIYSLEKGGWYPKKIPSLTKDDMEIDIIENEAREHLVYLLDNPKWNIEVIREDSKKLVVTIYYGDALGRGADTNKNMIDIKYDLLPYLELVSNKYDLYNSTEPFYINNIDDNWISLSELEKIRYPVNSISFLINLK